MLDSVLAFFRLARLSQLTAAERRLREESAHFNARLREFADRLGDAVTANDALREKYEPPSERLGVNEPWDMFEFIERVRRERGRDTKVVDASEWHPEEKVDVRNLDRATHQIWPKPAILSIEEIPAR